MSQDLLEFKAASGTYTVDELQGIVECFVAGIGNRDSVGDIVLPGAFSDSLKRRKPRVVWGHDWNAPIGKVIDIYEVGPTDPRLPLKMRQAGIGGLFARVQFNLKSERGREAFSSVLFFGEDQEWSIGYKTIDSIYSQEKQANLLKTLELYEVSPVLHGANQLTATVSIKSEKQEEQDKVDSFRKSKWKTFDPAFAEMIRTKYPEIWRLGGNIKGNDQYRALKPIHDRGGKANSQAEINALELREAWVARHYEDFRPAGVMAQIKWLAVGSRGEGYMKDVIREEIAKRQPDEKALSEFDALMEEIEEKGSGRPSGNPNPCWPGYEMIGMKPGKNGKMVPNCVPIEGEKAAPSAPDLDALTSAVGLDVPQERVTGDVMRGYGPRRGNLERLLRYWRPIMRKPGGFRRCRVILADHPELYPLENICAWLHHETTGIWPNEGCHHPGMKNCRKKIRGVVGGSLWSNDEWESRMRSRFAKKSDDYSEEDGDVTEMDILFAQKVLSDFLNENEDFARMLADESNWVHVGDDDDGDEYEHSRMHNGEEEEDGDEEEKGWSYVSAPSTGLGGRQAGEMPLMMMGRRAKKREDCGCGCKGDGDCGDKDDQSNIEVKAGRVISASNMTKLRQALSMLQEVLSSGGDDIQMKEMAVPALADEIRSLVDPIAEYYNIDIKVSDFGLSIPNFDRVSPEAKSAIESALDHVSGENAYIIIDTAPEDMMSLKSFIDEYSPSSSVIIDEMGGEWLAVHAPTRDFVEGFTRTLASSTLNVKGYGMGEIEYDCGCNE